LLRDGKLYELLVRCDEDLARTTREAGCRVCGGCLHRADYPRKPRGGFEGEEARRLSFCCAVDGCRKRATPPSVRFLGRRVYWAVVVVLLSVLAHGPTPARVRRLREELGVSRRTLARWRRWWLDRFVASAFWRSAKSRFAPPVDERELPQQLLERFALPDVSRVLALLRFLSPITTSSASGAF
jgi:hypothetical protein